MNNNEESTNRVRIIAGTFIMSIMAIFGLGACSEGEQIPIVVNDTQTRAAFWESMDENDQVVWCQDAEWILSMNREVVEGILRAEEEGLSDQDIDDTLAFAEDVHKEKC